MSKRNTQQRRDEILNLVNSQGEVSVDTLSITFETSEVTIRKDLAVMEREGLLLRRYGGAQAIPQESLPEDFRPSINEPKKTIASAAAALIRDHSRLVIDSGTTTAALIQELEHKQGLVVMTNSLYVANSLNTLQNKPALLMTGGTWDELSHSFQGQVAESVLRTFEFDQLFIGADGVDLERGTTTFNELVGLSRVMAEVSNEVILLVEAEKIGRKIPNLELPWDQIDVLVTTNDLTQDQIQKIQSHGVDVICVTQEN